MIKKTYALKIPVGFDPIAKLAWKLMEDSHELYEHESHLEVIDESAGFAEPTWTGYSFGEFEEWLILCFQEWISAGPENNPMWDQIGERIEGGCL